MLSLPVCRVRALVVFVMCGYCLSVDISVIWFIVFIQSFMFRYVIWISCTTDIGHYIGSIILGDRQIFYS